MTNKQTKAPVQKAPKTPKTIKISTLLLVVLAAAILLFAVGLGWVLRSDADAAYHANVLSEAQSLVSSLK